MRKRFFLILVVLLVLLLWQICLPKNPFSVKEVFFHVEKGQGSKAIALNLENQGLIWWGPLFQAYVLVIGASGDLQAGTYQFSPSMNILTIAGKFTSGDIAKARITIPEGFTSKQIHEKLKNVTRSDPVTLEKYEGYLFPDTYEILYGLELEKIIKIMTDNFNKKTATLKITPEVVIMASLLEKEVQTKEDKEIVSGIFWKRIKSGKPLESCATIAYIKGVSQWRYSYEDTRIESPYNTYLNLGLPSGPIGNPGLESIEAAIYPQDSDYWYYLSTPEGETIFSKTLEEHNYAKSKYLQ